MAENLLMLLSYPPLYPSNKHPLDHPGFNKIANVLSVFRDNGDMTLHVPWDNIFILRRGLLLWLSSSRGATSEKAAGAVPCLSASSQVATQCLLRISF